MRKGDNILIYFDDYPSNVYPWLALAEKGVEVRLMNTRGLGAIRSRDVMGQVDENTRLVALASCHFISGYRIDFQAIGRYLRERNILFCLDAIQTLGAFPTTVEQVDLLAADAHKWLLGPCGAGVLYVRRSVQDKINPPIYGWHNVNCPNFVAQEQIDLPHRGAEIRGRHAQPARPRRTDRGDGADPGARSGEHRARAAAQARACWCRRWKLKASLSLNPKPRRT